MIPNWLVMESLPALQNITNPSEIGLPASDVMRGPKRPAQALFDRGGAIHAWDPAFLLALADPGANRARPTIFDFLPEIDATAWTSIWETIESKGPVLLRPAGSGNAPSKAVSCLVIHRCLAEAGDLAVVTLEGEGSQIEQQMLLRLQHDVLEAVASGWSLRQVADLICRRAEQLAPDAVCSVLTVDPENRLRALAAPSLPEHYSQAIDGLVIGPSAGSCGTAVFRGEPVIASDISSDPLWVDYKHLALPLGLRACWSSPIRGRNGKITGAFAFYYRTPGGPNRLHCDIVDVCLHLCAIAIEHEETQSRIRKLALCDPLTGLPNRALFQQRTCDLTKVLLMSERTLAILYIDLDEFKAVNDTLGHWVGDLLLKAVASRLQGCCRSGEMVARLGGDEFAVLQYPVRYAAETDDLAHRILSCFSAPFQIEDRWMAIGASIGIARAPQDGASFIELLKRADVALYHAKRSGGCTHHFFNEEMDRDLQALHNLEDDLRAALAAGEISLCFQPFFDLASGAVRGFEALARWHHPHRGMIPPAQFIAVAEHAGLIGALGNFILAEACRHAAEWPSDLKLAVNLAPGQLIRPRFVLDVVAILAKTGLAGHRLNVEITEAVRIGENATIRKALNDLKMLGVGIVVDDFGRGSSALGYLRAFPFAKVKIDLTSLPDLAQNTAAQAIVEALIALATHLGMATTAEGVECEWQREWLRKVKCSEAQGFLLGRPMPAGEVGGFLAGLREAATPSYALAPQSAP